MRREQQIPLFLWVATALVAHALGGGGATEMAQRLEETMDIGSFASAVRAKAKFIGPVEVTFEETLPEEEDDAPQPEDTDAPKSDSDEETPTDVDPKADESDTETDDDVKVEEEKEQPPEEEKEPEKEKPKEKPPEVIPPEEKPPELTIAQKPKPKTVPNRRIAVQQHVQDQNQDDNPDARFAGEHANRVAEETQASITSTDQNASETSAGNTFVGSHPEPGNSEESKVAQSDENTVEDDRPGAGAQASPARAARASAAAMRQSPRLPASTPQEAQNAQKAREARAETEAREGMFETHHQAGSAWAIARAQEAQAAQEAQKARKAREAREKLRAFQKKKNEPLFGYGSTSTTENGVRLSLSQDMAQDVIGRDHLDNLKEEVGRRRLSQHRGSWTNVGLDRWRGAIENYVANVKPGNQTALNTARVPFAAYLNQIHQRLHQVFAHGFLGHLEQLPPKHPLNNQEMSTHLEIALSREDGRIVKMGVTKSSGVTAFDVGALESVSKAAPYGPPPGSIVSSDGNVYLHWEFHRNRNYACSTYFARPYIIDVGQEPAPPRVEPPPKPDERENRKPDERSGALEPENQRDRPNQSRTPG